MELVRKQLLSFASLAVGGVFFVACFLYSAAYAYTDYSNPKVKPVIHKDVVKNPYDYKNEVSSAGNRISTQEGQARFMTYSTKGVKTHPVGGENYLNKAIEKLFSAPISAGPGNKGNTFVYNSRSSIIPTSILQPLIADWQIKNSFGQVIANGKTFGQELKEGSEKGSFYITGPTIVKVSAN